MAVISEELGIFGVLFVIVLLAFVVLKGFILRENVKIRSEAFWQSGYPA